MKRKLIAIFAACITLTCALASCGDTDESDPKKSSGRKSSSSDVSDTDDDDKNDDDSDDDDDDDNDKKETTTTKSSKKKSDKTTTTTADSDDEDDVTTTKRSSGKNNNKTSGTTSSDDNDEAIGGDITGYWEISDSDEEKIAMGFDGNGNGSMYVDATSVMFFTSDQKFYMEGMELDTEFDGKTITVKADADDFGADGDDIDMDITIMTLERTGKPDSSSLDGEYLISGGIMGDMFADSFIERFDAGDDIPVYMIINGENFGIKLDKLFSYSTSGNTLTLSGFDAISDELDGIESDELPYSVNGDELTIFDDNGDIIKMSRFNIAY